MKKKKDLASADRFMVLNTCARSSVLPRFSSTGLLLSLSRSGGVVTWGSVPVTAQGALKSYVET